ncbi:undecaprenyldiphospho-muramoylpentapeptide beta-N-acetylglucosaminyltransferase [Arenibacter sp. GZD96]|uniref:undecaprenyldiphospho-muramoylpentapeptide beta-N-acetylglucosaminyltransferase n=1 Tax=Aurantibrevibacter litoralis TaxID=3106030 RepID=UPI002AFE3425|nr:undecaprenyldiphospho-muramoylpentapeptide beta-N-acetylglucosaminyltransferase [Arenibacter sp. GZD-96]MEA1786772.1 undecaprenyldiphospho-muramoylpentapeptide beta-N-acetylglucosaminyltransferase [Arenibacter sp. GZD-96]
MGNYKFIVSGGGTGGHIYPAIAIANALKQKFPNAEFLFVGAKDRMEMEKVPQAGYAIKGLWISGLQRKLSVKNVLFPIKIVDSLIKARNILAHFKPDVVIGTGGFASGPLVAMASTRNIPVLLQEQNSYAGITNKLLAKKAHTICVAYDGMEQFFPKTKIVKTGNPIRSELLLESKNSNEAFQFLGLDPNKKTVLILGGSLGAKKINELIKDNLVFFKTLGIQLIWQCGSLYYDTYKIFASSTVKVYDFLNRMDMAYAAAEIIISRAGASSVSELCVVGKPVLFIPSPNVAEDHQTKNALTLVEKDAALLLREKDVTTQFEATFSALVTSKERQKTLGENIKKLALPNATNAIVNEIEKLLVNQANAGAT